MMIRRNAAVVAILLTMMMVYGAANMVELESDGEISNTDESTTVQTIVKILYCTS